MKIIKPERLEISGSESNTADTLDNLDSKRTAEPQDSDKLDPRDDESENDPSNHGDANDDYPRTSTPPDLESRREAYAHMGELISELPREIVRSLAHFRMARTIVDVDAPINLDDNTYMDGLIALSLQLAEGDADNLVVLDQPNSGEVIGEMQKKRFEDFGRAEEVHTEQPEQVLTLKFVRVFTPDHATCPPGTCSFPSYGDDPSCSPQATPEIFKSIIGGTHWRELGLPKYRDCEFEGLEVRLWLEMDLENFQWWDGVWLMEEDTSDAYEVRFEEVEGEHSVPEETCLNSAPLTEEEQEVHTSEQKREDPITAHSEIPSCPIPYPTTSTQTFTSTHLEHSLEHLRLNLSRTAESGYPDVKDSTGSYNSDSDVDPFFGADDEPDWHELSDDEWAT